MTITIDEVIQILRNDIELSKMNICFCHNNEYGIGALQMAVETLEQTRWIPVSERLPENEGVYLVTFKLSFMNFIEVCTFNKAGWNKVGYDEVIAWMPLPEVYQGGDTDVQ